MSCDEFYNIKRGIIQVLIIACGTANVSLVDQMLTNNECNGLCQGSMFSFGFSLILFFPLWFLCLLCGFSVSSVVSLSPLWFLGSSVFSRLLCLQPHTSLLISHCCVCPVGSVFHLLVVLCCIASSFVCINLLPNVNGASKQLSHYPEKGVWWQRTC